MDAKEELMKILLLYGHVKMSDEMIINDAYVTIRLVDHNNKLYLLTMSNGDVISINNETF